MISRKRISITTWIIIVNVACFIAASIAVAFNKNFLDFFVLNPANIFEKFYLWTIFTSMFLHANISHLFFNMFSLFFIGKFLEKIIGRKRYFWLYIVSGLVSSIVFASLAYFFGYGIGAKIFGSPITSGVGASGAIFGLAGLLTILVPRSRVYLILGPLLALVLDGVFASFLSGSVYNIVSFFVTIYMFFSIIAMFSFNSKLMKIAIPVEMPFWLLPIVAIVPLVIVGLFIPLPIGNSAHFGGLIAGLAYGIYLARKYPKKVKMLRKYFT